MAKKQHLGFKETQAKIAKKQGISMKAAGAILASSARKASPAAVKKNPALLNVKRGIKKFGDGGLQKAKGQYIKAKGQYIKAKGLEIKAKGQNMKPEVPKSIYKQSYSVTPVVKGAKEDDKIYEKVQVLNKGPKTVVNRTSFARMAEGYKTGMDKSTTVYDKKTGATKKSVAKFKKGGKKC